MNSEDENMELEKEAPILASIGKKNNFEVPNGYFENLSEQILNQALLNDLAGNKNNFELPNGYFESLDQQIISSIYLDTIKTNSAESNGFDVPVGYFADSKQRLLNSINTQPKKSKVIKLHFVRYAAAACILFTTSLGIYFNVKSETSINTQLSKIPAKEIESYLNQHTDSSDLPMLIENIDETNLTIDDFNADKTN